MSDSKPPGGDRDDRAAAARAFRERGTTTSSRISALVADAGLACRFQSILATDGKPFGELALLFATGDDWSHNEATILRKTPWGELMKGAAAFRQRAAAEFATAGLAAEVVLYLPYFCVFPEVEAIGPALDEVFIRARLAPSRVVAEIIAPASVDDVPAAEARAVWLRAVGARVALRANGADAVEAAVLATLAPDYLHITRLPETHEEREPLRRLVTVARSAGARAIVGPLDVSDETRDVDGLGIELLYGDAIAPARFLC